MNELTTSQKGYNITVVSPLGGSGTRLYPLTLGRPKPLIPIANTPIFEAAVIEWIKQGVTDFIFGVTGYANRVGMYDHFNHGGRFKTNFPNVRFLYANYNDDEFSRKGSADVFLWSLNHYREMIGNNDVLLINGDNLSKVDLGDLCESHRQKQAVLTIAVKGLPQNDPRLTDLGTVTFDPNTARVTRFDEKSKTPYSNYGNTAICLFSPKFYDVINSKEMRELLAEHEGRQLDVGGALAHIFS